ncbi:kinase-like protein [Wolfiporia cocos MD-104 SS10]|uniref:dual-specificity kinase n=1 Tax=Wolfiporia cocos (strain MD-104) TaxID=742152 RepID=A0A2H3JNT3_WOLCO|nr:kinase-like protein [Wolfiporia cocos MD-104 SS10]
MGRKRGKTLSSAQSTPKKSEPVPMPPIQISALPAATAQRVASLKSSNSSLNSNAASSSSSRLTASRATAQTVSSMQKQSDASLRGRNQLPTIAGSPSVGSIGSHTVRESKEPSSSSLNPSSLLKETPTKIPRISSRSSTTNSPTLKANGTNRRASLLVSNNAYGPSRGNSPSAGNETLNEFGVLESAQTPGSKAATSSQRHSFRASPSATASSRVPRQVSVPTSTSTTTNGTSPRKNRESMSFGGLRKSSTGSVASVSSAAQPQQNEHSTSHRFSALSPSKGLKLLSPKMSLPVSRSSNSSSSHSIHQAMAAPSTSSQSLKTPSPAPSVIDEEELLGDEEMAQYIRRQQAKKLATGATQEELDSLLRFPEPIRPTAPMTPTALLKSPHAQHLSEYERREVLEFPSVYFIGAHSDKKQATVENETNNHGYDDDRGDYLVVNRDHLAYRYEVIDTLGKGSFGQVLHCRDHCTGESVAIKIIRNKKRFHHQALVEIKILDSLRKWDQDEKHHVIKMTEHFYFRGHLCIAMELLSINLYELIKANGFVGFTTALIRRFTSQMLQSLCLMRHHRIVHCDLKPENVLLRHPAKSAIKVIDFGSSCFETEKIYTYIQSRFYRSPEVILGMNYHMAIDMWSLGCILAELYTGFPIFPGENEQEQLSCIMEVLGVPDKDFINRSSRKRLFFDTAGNPRPVVNSKGRRRRPGTKTLAQVLRCDDEQFVDFIAKCLMWDPERRMKPQAALRHPFITSGRRPKITSPTPSTPKVLMSSSTSFTSSRTTKPMETPKKSMISAPTPLTARTTRTTAAVPNAPNASTSTHTSRSYRTQAQAMSSYQSSRTMVSSASKGIL